MKNENILIKPLEMFKGHSASFITAKNLNLKLVNYLDSELNETKLNEIENIFIYKIGKKFDELKSISEYNVNYEFYKQSIDSNKLVINVTIKFLGTISKNDLLKILINLFDDSFVLEY